MVRELENSMVVDSKWSFLNTSPEISERLKAPGYKEVRTGIFVPEEDAYEYALERVSLDEDLKREFEEMVVEWFYSVNWVKED